ncbi:MAG: A/G-specific adenine glycosylase [Bacteroidales bacterium]|jgi:A/G-specific adenine glycosylase|nr:A/G-specific adenine glycosylase [Bacteroidales bacterium]
MNWFSTQLIDWYRDIARDLPWRNIQNPYLIWISEVVLQQTQVKFGLPYYQRIVKKHPDIASLATAKPDEFLRLWQGLGYYQRAKNLLEAAKQIQTDFDGIFPNRYSDILKLKGVGEYTAAAIASFAFQEAVPVVDGNVKRVICRIFEIDEYPESAKGKQEIRTALNSVFDAEQPDIFNQAIMEFGALQCRKNPNCEICIFQENCLAYQNNKVLQLPVKKPVKAKSKRYFHYFLHRIGSEIAIVNPAHTGIWVGLYEFPKIESERFLTDAELNENLVSLLKNPDFELELINVYPVHILSHQEIYSKIYFLKSDLKFPDANYYSLPETDDLPKSRLVDKILQDSSLVSLIRKL